MENISELENSLNGHLKLNKARIKCFTQMLLALFAVRTPNLKEIATAVSSKTRIDSRHKRLKRFFSQVKVDYDAIGSWIFNLFFANEKQLYLTLDRTNWSYGKTPINIMMLAIAYEGIAIPIFWQMLDKDGTSSAEEQKFLIEKFIKLFGKERIHGVLADREFGNNGFFNWLIKEKIPFYIRIKGNANVKVLNAKPWSAEKLFRDLGLNMSDPYENYVTIYGVQLRVAAARSERGELLIVATNGDAKVAVTNYLRRWEIENLFQGLKGRGFNFEETRITKPERVAKLLSLLVIGFCWAHKAGEWLDNIRPIKFGKYRNFLRREIRPKNSFFRYGFDLLRDIILHLNHKLRQIKHCIKLLFYQNNQHLEDVL